MGDKASAIEYQSKEKTETTWKGELQLLSTIDLDQEQEPIFGRMLRIKMVRQKDKSKHKKRNNESLLETSTSMEISGDEYSQRRRRCVFDISLSRKGKMRRD